MTTKNLIKGVHWKDWYWSWSSNILSPYVKNWLIRNYPAAGKDWRQEEKGMTEDEMAGWHHRLDGHEFGWTPGVGDGQGGLACCESWGRKESDTTERLIWSDAIIDLFSLFFHSIIFFYILPFLSMLQTQQHIAIIIT